MEIAAEGGRGESLIWKEARVAEEGLEDLRDHRVSENRLAMGRRPMLGSVLSREELEEHVTVGLAFGFKDEACPEFGEM